MNKIYTILLLLFWGFVLSGCDEELPEINDVQTINYSITTNEVSDVGLFSAVLHAKVNMPLIDSVYYTVGFQLSTDSIFPTELTHLCIADSISEDSCFSFSIYRGVGYDVDMPSLQPGTQYYVRSFIKYNEIAYLGAVKSFNTAPIVITTGVMDSISHKIDCKINVFSEGYWIEGTLGICYSNKPEPTVDDFTVSNKDIDIALQEDGTFSITINRFVYGGNFYYRAYYSDNIKTYYGNTQSIPLPYKAVDLGLTVNWAICNVGATTDFEKGSYFAWGETDSKSNYSWETYKWCNGSSNTLTKYNYDSSYGTVDNKSILDAEDDAAHVLWGGSWRMPTSSEFQELINNCTWTWTTQNDVNGYMVTSNFYPDRSIFLPAGSYWSSSLILSSPYKSCFLHLNSNSRYTSNEDRMLGQSIRPVLLSDTWLNDINLKFIEENDTILIGSNNKLSATIKKNNVAITGFNFEIVYSSDNPSIATVDANGTIVGVSKGTAVITASWRTKVATCTISVIEDSEVEHEYVDLGLSVKWATCNIGAYKPESNGSYFAWGETEIKSDYSWETYKWCNGSYTSLTKYNSSSSFGTVDYKTVLDLEDDVAHVLWGDNWRMPTNEEFQELINECTWAWTTQNGVNGYLVTSNKSGYTDRSIFLPALESSGSYWSRSLYTNRPYDTYFLYFYSSDHRISYNGRHIGYTVRPVCP